MFMGTSAISSQRNNTAFDLTSQRSKVSTMRQLQQSWQTLLERIRALMDQNDTTQGTKVESVDVSGPQTVPSHCFYTPMANLEAFLFDKLAQ